MAWKSHPCDDSQIDPFNAPDPVMPSEEPSLDAPDVSAADASSTRAAHVSRSKHRDRHVWHRSAPSATNDAPARADVPAGTGKGHSAKAASNDAPPRSPRRSTKRSHCLIYLIVIIVIFSAVVGPLFSACSTALDDAFDTLFDSDSDTASYSTDDRDYYSSPDYETELQLEQDVADEARAQTEDRLNSLIAGDEAALDLLETDFKEAFETYFQFTPEEAGIDAREVARWALSNFSYGTLDANGYVYSADDGTYEVEASVYFDTELPDIDDVAYDLRRKSPRALWYADNKRDAMTPELQEELRTDLQETLDDYTGERSSRSASLSFSGTAQADGSEVKLAIDEEDWQFELSWMLG